MMKPNHKVIQDHEKFEAFVTWLPELEKHEAYYVTLLGRRKYHQSALTDKTSVKRFVATSKPYLVHKVQQLSLPLGLYVNRDGNALHQDALALYISLNPRSLKLAQQNLLRRLVDVTIDPGNFQNPAALALAEIQKARSRSVFIDFDFDIQDELISQTAQEIQKIVGKEAVTFLRTRGGLHALVQPKSATKFGPKRWHQEISSLPGCDVVGDSLIPVPGGTQGGFTPHFFQM
ncbi:MAG: hypothetical protein ABJG15_14350 [Hyphomonadaceae bacterium]